MRNHFLKVLFFGVQNKSLKEALVAEISQRYLFLSENVAVKHILMILSLAVFFSN
jgi:hypothetical protein